MSQGVRSVGPMAILDLLLPPRCAGCDAFGPSPCARCARALRPAPVSDPPDGLESVAALLRYDATAGRFVTAVKYRNARASLDVLGGAVAALVAPERSRLDVVTWAPTTPARRHARGFDQAELLARVVATHLGLPHRRCLERLPGPQQTGLSAEARHGAPRFVGRPPAPGRVLVVDDVCTTGATLSAAARALREAGTRQVRGLVMARTPGPGVHR